MGFVGATDMRALSSASNRISEGSISADAVAPSTSDRLLSFSLESITRVHFANVAQLDAFPGFRKPGSENPGEIQDSREPSNATTAVRLIKPPKHLKIAPSSLPKILADPATRYSSECNIHKRGHVKPTLVSYWLQKPPSSMGKAPPGTRDLKKEQAKYPVGPIILGALVFVVIGGGEYRRAGETRSGRPMEIDSCLPPHFLLLSRFRNLQQALIADCQAIDMFAGRRMREGGGSQPDGLFFLVILSYSRRAFFARGGRLVRIFVGRGKSVNSKTTAVANSLLLCLAYSRGTLFSYLATPLERAADGAGEGGRGAPGPAALAITADAGVDTSDSLVGERAPFDSRNR
ncbi:hypothetical protein BDK51DRAFT_41597 [Blyttiomyces helicus]|uniref:Uncharacterized protein n=1 Tax=Blyttiomyces helicus TaxID=388810 RepID=A0A4P9WJ28_9FUNG|nr:hypothetical protein BDK51DRAFT_41597 [Blyttiomyces helicus]|eukprot:RKO92824.1 hypothetical protein BDK51DRAFT_41597 [Blyttiomyces helicus]